MTEAGQNAANAIAAPRPPAEAPTRAARSPAAEAMERGATISPCGLIRRCIAFARAWGYGAMCMANLFAYRATQPADMLAQDDPVGPENDAYLRRLAAEAGVVVAAWGTHGTHGGRHNAVRAMMPGLHYLRLTKDGHPGHPLYLPASLRPVEWVRPGSPQGASNDN
jgi:hypothetical protein